MFSTPVNRHRLKESASINQSVSAIRRVFETLRFNQTHPDSQQVVPYRTNKLTMLLKPMFTGLAGKLGLFCVLLNAYPGRKDYDEKRACLKVCNVRARHDMHYRILFARFTEYSHRIRTPAMHLCTVLPRHYFVIIL